MHPVFALVVATVVVTAPTQALQWVLSTLCPLATAIVTKEALPSWAKALINALLAVVVTLVSVSLKQDGKIDVNHWILAIGQAELLAWASYASFWRPTIAPKLQKATANFGIGPSS